MKPAILLLFCISAHQSFTQSTNGLEITDLSQMEIRLLNQYKNVDSIVKSTKDTSSKKSTKDKEKETSKERRL